MKFRILTVTLLSLLISGVYAQTEKKTPAVKPEVPKTKVYRVEAGYTQPLRYGDKVSNTLLHGISLGGTVEYPFKKNIGLVTGLKYSYLFGSKTQLYPNYAEANYSYTGHSLDVPVRLSYTVPIFWGLKLFGFAGPNFNVGLAQNTDVVYRDDDNTATAPYVTGGKFNLYNTELNRFSIQFGAGGGIQWKDYRLKAGYDWGLNSISKDKDSPQKLKGWYATFEYDL